MSENVDTGPAATRLTYALRGAVLAIRWEHLWRALWAPLAVITLFVGVALTDVLPALPDFVHAMLLVLMAVLLGYAAAGFKGAFKPISGEEAARRVEMSSGLTHRPLTALFDRPAAEKLSAEAQILWQAHIARALKSTEKLTVPTPKPGVAAMDMRGLRFLPILVLFAGVLIGGSEPLPRLMRALTPMGGNLDAAMVRMDLWITPPTYTGLAPSVFNGIGPRVATEDGAEAPPPRTLIVPVGSEILVHATGAGQQPSLTFDGRAMPLERLGDEDSTSYKLETKVGDDAVGTQALGLTVGGTELAGWPVLIATDTPPSVEFTRAPQRRRDTQLEVAYLAQDDYGVAKMEMTIRRPSGRPVPGGEAEIRVELPVTGDRRRIETTTARDFSAHPWAGLPVHVRLVAEDTAGHVVTTEPVEVVMPERIFNHPVARALAESRKALNDPDPDVIEAVADGIRELSYYPMRFFDDTVAFLAIRIAHTRLRLSEGAEQVPSVQKLLWETALRIEDGEFALAEAELMRLQEEAMQALRDGKLGEELDRVMRELQEAMDRYMQALSERLEEMGLDQLPPMANQEQMQAHDIQEMMDRIKELAESGNREAAEQMLAEMQRMLEQLREGMKMQQDNPAMAEAKKLMDQMRALTEDQQKLLDRTFQQSRDRENRQDGAMQQPRMGQQGQRQQGQQQGQQGQQGQQQGQQGQQGENGEGQQQAQNGSPSQADQEALRKRLGELMMQMDQALGQIPGNLGRAEQQMEQAGKNLGKGEFRDATGNQMQALQELRNATNQMAEAMARQFGAQMGLATGSRQMPGGQQGFDPFGRRQTEENGQGTSVEDSDVQLPSRMEIRRAREILDELRRRSGERSRPQLELDYIDRLLDIF